MATVYDTLEILEDGSVVYIQNTIEKLFDGEDGREWLDAGTSTTEYITYYQVQRDAKNGGDALRVICDKATGLAAWKDPVQTGCSMGTSDQALYLSFKKTDVPTKNDVNAYLSKNPYTIKYQLATPIVTHIPKELVPTILTQQTNTIEVGGSVKPNSFSITVPTTDGIKKEYTLTPINGWKGTAKANLLQTGDIGLVLDLTIPSSFNVSICSLATELRPKAERTVLGYNGNTPVVVKIGTDGTVKLPISTTGTVKLDDTYKL